MYRGKTWKWDTIILNKTEELGRFILGRSQSLDFTEPTPRLSRDDSLGIRRRILEITQKEARRLGISKSTLHHLRKSAEDERAFRVYRTIKERLQERSLVC
jgi:hypothetical protein